MGIVVVLFKSKVLKLKHCIAPNHDRVFTQYSIYLLEEVEKILDLIPQEWSCELWLKAEIKRKIHLCGAEGHFKVFFPQQISLKRGSPLLLTTLSQKQQQHTGETVISVRSTTAPTARSATTKTHATELEFITQINIQHNSTFITLLPSHSILNTHILKEPYLHYHAPPPSLSDSCNKEETLCEKEANANKSKR
uniref:Uncharacterized protein n=1 Tax=Octopus bimaculoides TaxID=37653 RepID=A0A0L8GYD2_OCTBM